MTWSVHCHSNTRAASGGHAVVTQLAFASPGPPGHPDIITTRFTPSSPARRIVSLVTARCASPWAPGCNGLPEQLSALIARPRAPISPRKASRLRVDSNSGSIWRCGADDQLPQPNSSVWMPSFAAVSSNSASGNSGNPSVTRPMRMDQISAGWMVWPDAAASTAASASSNARNPSSPFGRAGPSPRAACTKASSSAR